MERKAWIGKKGLFIYSENDKVCQCYGQVLSWDDLFLQVKTDRNTLLIPNRFIQKIKFPDGEAL